MLKSREELQDKLDLIVNQYSYKKKILKEIKDKFSERGFEPGKIQTVWTKLISWDELTQVELYLFTKFLHEITRDNIINPSTFFTEVEIKDGDNYKNELQNEELNYPIVFQNTIKIDDYHYICTIDGRYLKQLNDSKIISYNFETQRNAKYREKDGELIKVANVNRESVKEIRQDLINNDFITNTLTLNVLADGNDEINYDNRRKEIIIHSGQINIIDGFHRNLACIEALGTNPELECIWEIRITNWNVERARKFIFQEDKRNKINKRYVQSIANVDKWGNKIIALLNQSRSDIAGKIVVDISLLDKGYGLTLSDLFSESIDILWDINTNMEANKLSKWLGQFFDYLIGLYPDEFVNNIVETRKTSVINMPVIFVGYLALAKALQGDNEWDSKLESFMSSTNFDIENTAWEDYKVTKNKHRNIYLRKPDYNRLIAFFQKEVL